MLAFSKYSGSGNDFILIDNRNNCFPSASYKELVQNLCQRHYGIGADGLVLLQNSVSAMHRMRIFNSDGGEASMCGNAICCLALFLERLGLFSSPHDVETAEGSVQLERTSLGISWSLDRPIQLALTLQLSEYELDLLHTGVPHLVYFSSAIDTMDLSAFAPLLRHHPSAGPAGANVNIAELLPTGLLRYRTYERGVEGETLACATGAAAVALAAERRYGLASPITVQTAANKLLYVSFQKQGEEYCSVSVIGQASHIFDGKICLQNKQ